MDVERPTRSGTAAHRIKVCEQVAHLGTPGQAWAGASEGAQEERIG